MKVFVAGGGPAGLYAAYLIKKNHPDAEITLVEQNDADATFGFGVVFSDKALEFLKDDDPETYTLIASAMQMWTDLTIVHGGNEICIDGIGFAAIGRLHLLKLLQQRVSSTGIKPQFNTVMQQPPNPADYDLVIVSDGVNSPIRSAYADSFGTSVETLNNHFVWYGTTKEFPTLTQTFVESSYGSFNAHHYRYAPSMSTFIAECTHETWMRAGLEAMSEEASRIFCETLFADVLDDHPLITNRSLWRNFPKIRNERWYHRNMVLVGDALRTAHFSIGSGTRLALEDVIALIQALKINDFDVKKALPAYEEARRPVVDKLVGAANASAAWYENFEEHMKQSSWDFAWSYIQRSGRIDPEKLRRIAPKFVDRYQSRKVTA